MTDQNKPARINGLGQAAGLLALAIWSGTAVANKVAVQQLDGLTVGTSRSLAAGGIAIAIVLIGRLPLPSSKRDLALLALTGLSSFAAWPILLSIGVQRTTVAHTAVAMATIPIATVLISAGVERQVLSYKWWAGAGLSLAATAALVSHQTPQTSTTASGTLVGDLIVLAGCLTCSIGYVAGAQVSPKIGSISVTFWGLTTSLVIVGPAFLLTSTHREFSDLPAATWLALAWLILLSSIAGYALWYFALACAGTARIVTLQLLMPVLTLATAILFLKEDVDSVQIAIASVILVGTVIAQQHAPAAPSAQ